MLMLGVSYPLVSAAAQDANPHFSNYGWTGVVELPSARMAAENTLSASISYTPETRRDSLTFQAMRWLEATYSYQEYDPVDVAGDKTSFEHQLDVKFRLLKETDTLPAIAVGFQDILGASAFSSEYIVANKRFGAFDVSAGLGWGRLGSQGHITNPLALFGGTFEQRNSSREVNFGNFFQGNDAAFFGSVIWDTPIPNLSLLAEYDSDTKANITGFERNIPLNFGVRYTPFNGFTMTGFLLQGSSFGLTGTLSADITQPLFDRPNNEPYLKPFAVREGRGFDPKFPAPETPVQPLTATPLPHDARLISERLADRLTEQGLALHSVSLSADTLQVTLRNETYRAYAQAAGRVARILTEIAPENIEYFRIAFIEKGLLLSEIDLIRNQLETSARERGYTASPPAMAGAFHTDNLANLANETAAETHIVDSTPRFEWFLGPDIQFSIADPNNPLRYQLDTLAEASLEVTDGLFLSGALRLDVLGNFEDIKNPSNRHLPTVRSDFAEYYRQTDINIERLSVDYFFSPANNLYARLSAGALERHYVGFGGEILYRPSHSHLAFGAEAYYAHQRDFGFGLGLRDYNTFTGHASLYYDSNLHDIDFALHAGRYLAKDWGVTIEASKRLSNGWAVGAFASFTDVDFEKFGDGGFDQGITLNIPLDWGLPYEGRATANATLRPSQRDGGQRLRIQDRLYDVTRGASALEVARQWHEFSN